LPIETRNGRVNDAVETGQIVKLTLALVALVLLASLSQADEAFHCPDPGTVMTFSDGGSLTFTTQEGLTCQARTNKGSLVSQFLGLAVPGSDLEKNHGERLFPWRVGNQIDFMTSGTTANATGDLVTTVKDVYFDNTIKVVGQEKLTTPAGSFDTFVVEWHRQVKGRWSGTWLTTVWFAPELGYVIKSKHETRQGYGPETSYEIASIALPKGSTAPAARATPAPQPPTRSAALPVTPTATNAAAVDTIKLEQGNGTFLVPVQVNGRLTLNFVLDSGAADVAIPADVVQILTRAGTISKSDFIGTKTYVLADGSKLPSEAFIVHELKVGDHIIRNVTASVTPIQGKLLLGQSFLSKLPAWTIDNKQHALIIMGDPAGSAGAEPVATTPQASVAVAPKAAPAPQPAKVIPLPPPVASVSSSPAMPPPPVVAASAHAVGAGAAGETGFRCPHKGTFVQYSNGTTLRFAGESGFRCAYVDQNYRDAEKFAGFADDAKFLDAGLDKLWPLTIGKQQAFSVSMSGAYLTYRFTVLRTETVVIPAGTFDVFVIEQEETGTGSQWAKRFFWYAPDTGLIVKSTFTLLKTADSAIRGGSATASLIPGDYQAVRIEGSSGGKSPP
jgi:clan AA aspartic protease (TIGR02281 family)